jgi:hypothetical protein
VLALYHLLPALFHATYPSLSNPAADEVPLKLPTAAVAGQRVARLNVCGPLVRAQGLPAGSTRTPLSLPALSAGVYFVQSGSTMQKLLRQQRSLRPIKFKARPVASL